MMTKIPDLAAIRDWCKSKFQPAGNYASVSDIPTQTSQLTNDSGFVTKLIDDLANYYKKSETYTKEEVATLIAGINTMQFSVVTELPTEDISTSSIYLAPADDAKTGNVYDEYLYVNGQWEIIGNTAIELSGYARTEQLNSYLEKTGDASDTSVTFDQAMQKANIQSGDSLAVAFGKLAKFCADLKPIAFSGSYKDLSDAPGYSQVAYSGKYDDLVDAPDPNFIIDYSVSKTKRDLADVATSGSYTDLINTPDVYTLTNNLLATIPGTSALDATQGRVLNDKITQINSDLAIVPKIIRYGNVGDSVGHSFSVDLSIYPFASQFMLISYHKIAHIMRYSATVEIDEIGNDNWTLTANGLTITFYYAGTRFYSLIKIT